MGKRKKNRKRRGENNMKDENTNKAITNGVYPKSMQNFGSSSQKNGGVATYNWGNNPTFKPPHIYKGVLNQTAFPEFVEICKKTQKELIDLLPAKLIDAGYTDVVLGDGFIYATGDLPILLTAHMDTVHKEPVKDFYEFVDEKGNHIISSPQGIGGDDRCGIYMILEIIKEFKPYILFCEDEEIGCVGSRAFCDTDMIMELESVKFLIELDRANAKDAVFYDCDNADFTKFIEETTGYKKAWGSCSDISNLAPGCGVAAVNLSCGYYHPHSLEEEVNMEEMLHTIEVTKKLLTAECEQFEYVERVWSTGNYYGRWSDYDWEDYYERMYSKYNEPKEAEKKVVGIWLRVEFYDAKNMLDIEDSFFGNTEAEAWVKFYREYPYACYNDVYDFDIDEIKV